MTSDIKKESESEKFLSLRKISEEKDGQILDLLNKLSKTSQANQEMQSLLNTIDSELLGQKHRLSVVSDK